MTRGGESRSAIAFRFTYAPPARTRRRVIAIASGNRRGRGRGSMMIAAAETLSSLPLSTARRTTSSTTSPAVRASSASSRISESPMKLNNPSLPRRTSAPVPDRSC